VITSLEHAPAAGEVGQLQRLKVAGIPVVETTVLMGLEVEFYQLGNLAEQLRRTFAGVFGARLDEEKLEAASAQAERLLRESYLLPERSEEVKAALPGGSLLVRYAGEAPFSLEPGPQEALWALKRLWASRWQVDAVLERAPELAPPEVPSLIQAVQGSLELDPILSQQASQVLGAAVRIWSSSGRAVWVAVS